MPLCNKAQQGYNGIFFLEPYHPDKIPVLYIHDISGFGQRWRHIIDRLDRERFQPWVVQYPSGLRLSLLSRVINEEVTQLQIEYRFESLVVVAHSMGGLVARGFISRNATQDNRSAIKLFATISTPWGGHNAARSGVTMAPVVVPSWYDMVPGSPYIESLFERPLPDHTSYYLMFGHRATRSFVSRASSDGTVTLRSQLPPKVQYSARKVFGYDEDHVSILQSEAVADKLNEIMMAVQKQE